MTMWRVRAVLISAPLIVLFTTVMASLSLLSGIFNRDGRTQHTYARIWSEWLLKLAFVRLKTFGMEKLRMDGSYVLVSNHCSYLDIPVILSSVPVQIRFFAKKGLFSIPFLGWHLRHAGHLEVVRGDARASLRSMTEGARLIRERGISVVLFPEGGRTPIPGIRPFKEGAAHIAIKAGVPVVPVGLVNVRNALPMGSMLLRPVTVEIHIGDPIETADLRPSDRGSLNDKLQAQVIELSGDPLLATPDFAQNNSAA
jgi:1-acyl-sn-glycerol-3-phosphate acyltransferase